MTAALVVLCLLLLLLNAFAAMALGQTVVQVLLIAALVLVVFGWWRGWRQ